MWFSSSTSAFPLLAGEYLWLLGTLVNTRILLALQSFGAFHHNSSCHAKQQLTNFNTCMCQLVTQCMIRIPQSVVKTILMSKSLFIGCSFGVQARKISYESIQDFVFKIHLLPKFQEKIGYKRGIPLLTISLGGGQSETTRTSSTLALLLLRVRMCKGLVLFVSEPRALTMQSTMPLVTLNSYVFTMSLQLLYETAVMTIVSSQLTLHKQYTIQCTIHNNDIQQLLWWQSKCNLKTIKKTHTHRLIKFSDRRLDFPNGVYKHNIGIQNVRSGCKKDAQLSCDFHGVDKHRVYHRM